MKHCKIALSVLLTLALLLGLALPATAQRSIAAPEAEYVQLRPRRLPGFLHPDTRGHIAAILRNTASQFTTGAADRQEIRDLFAGLPLVTQEEVRRTGQFASHVDFLWQLPGLRSLDFVLMETGDPDIFWLGFRHIDWLGRTRYVFDMPAPIEYNRATGVFQALHGSGIFGIAFDYDSEQHLVFASQRPFLGWFGYNLLIDFIAPFACIELSTVRVPFYYDGDDWQVQLWKGNYLRGFHGAEFGFYRRVWSARLFDFVHFEAAQDFIIPMTLDVYHGENRQFSTAGDRWWIAGLQYGRPGVSVFPHEELRVYGTMEFPSEGMLQAFLPAFEAHSPPGMTGEADGLRFSFVWYTA